MIRSINNDEDNCLSVETVICKVYFPHNEASESHSMTWPSSSCELKQLRNKEIRRFHITNKSFNQFFDLVTSSIMEPAADVELLILDADSDWIPVDCEEQWSAALSSARTIPNKKHRQLRVKVTTRNGSSVTPKPSCGSSRTKGSKQSRTSSRRNTSCCIVPTKPEAYSCVSSSTFLSIKQDFCDLQKQMEAMRLQQQGQPKEGQPEKKKKKKASSDKKKRSNKTAPSEIVTQMVYHHHAEMFNWSPSKWGSDSSSIAVL